eukprot:525779_1
MAQQQINDQSNSKTYAFLIKTQPKERPFQIQISNPTINKIKQVIYADIMPKSLFQEPLKEIAWSINYIEKEDKFTKLTKDAQLNDIINNPKIKGAISIGITFDEPDRFQAWRNFHKDLKIGTPVIKNIEHKNNTLHIHLNLPKNMHMYVIEYNVQQQVNQAKREYMPRHIAHKSPIIISNLWPYADYRFRVRLASKLFPNGHIHCSLWTKWKNYLKITPGPLRLYNKDKGNNNSNKEEKKQTEEFYKSEIELYDKKQL